DSGALYTFSWVNPAQKDIPAFRHIRELGLDEMPDPMNEDPLKLLPDELRARFEESVNKGRKADDYKIRITGDLNPASRFMYRELMRYYNGDWNRVIEHVRVRRL